MAFQVEPTYETDDLFCGRSMFLSRPGAYHAQLIEAAERMDEGYLELTFEVVGPQENGKKIDGRWYFTDQEGNPQYAQIIGTAINLGLFTVEQYEAAKAARQPLDIDFEAATCRQCIIDVKENKYTKDGVEKTGIRLWPDGVKHLDDKEYEKVPLNQELAAIAGARRSGSPFADMTGGAQAPSQPPQQQPAQPPQEQPSVAQQQQQQPQPAAQRSVYDDI